MPQFTAAAVAYYRATGRAIHTDRITYILVAAYLLVGGLSVVWRGGTMFGDFDIYALGCGALCCVVLPYASLVFGITRITLRLKRRRALARRYLLAPRRVGRLAAGTLLTLAILVLFQEMFSAVKSSFSSGDFGYDKLVADIDKFVHFGHAPVRYMLNLAQNDWVLRILEANYHGVWFGVWFGILYWVAVSPKADGLRVRYCVTFCLVWILVGNVIAGLLPTAGPGFYGLVTGDPTRFARLHHFLQGSGGDLSATAISQQYLWHMHEEGLSGFGSGISAFPSIHVALIATNAFFMLERSRWLGLLTVLYTLLIMVSSVYLGWHYAVDGYAAVLLSFAIYWGVKRGLPRFALGLERGLAGAPARPLPGGETSRQPG